MNNPEFIFSIDDCSKKELDHNTLARLFYKDYFGREHCVAYVFYQESIEEINKEEVLESLWYLAIKPNVRFR